MNDNKTSKNSIVAKFAVPISFLICFSLQQISQTVTL